MKILGTFNSIDDITNAEIGDIAYINEKLKQYTEDGWKDYEGKAEFKMGLYDLNKAAISQLPDMTPDDLENKFDMLNEFKKKTRNKFYMLLCHEKRYYTVFAGVDENEDEEDDDLDLTSFAITVIDLLNYGCKGVKSVDLTSDGGAVEIWANLQDDLVCMYLFPCDGCVEYYMDC